VHNLKKLANLVLFPIKKFTSPRKIPHPNVINPIPTMKSLASLVTNNEKSLGNLLFKMPEANQ